MRDRIYGPGGGGLFLAIRVAVGTDVVVGSKT